MPLAHHVTHPEYTDNSVEELGAYVFQMFSQLVSEYLPEKKPDTYVADY